MAEAESVLPGRPKMASMSFSMDDLCHFSSPPESEKKTQPTFTPFTLPACTLSETSHLTNGSLPSPIITPEKPSTLGKSSSKKKSKSSKDPNSKHAKKTLHSSPKDADRNNEECPYSDLESVPKILCPKALERQTNSVPSQPSVMVAKELKKQPEVQSGLWFSKSGKDRRPKTTSPIPDRSLFSKAPSKKKNSSTVCKKTLVTSTPSYVSGSGDPVLLLDKNKPAETSAVPQKTSTLNCTNNQAGIKTSDSVEASVDQPDSLDRENNLPSVQVVCLKARPSFTKSKESVTDPSSGKSEDTDDKRAPELSKNVDSDGQSSLLKSKKNVSETKNSVKNATKPVNDTIFDQEKKTDETIKPCLQSKSNDSLSILEKQKNLVSKCRLPYVKLIRKEIKDRRYLNSSGTFFLADLCKEKEKGSDVTKTCESPQKESRTSASKDHSVAEPEKVSVKKVKTIDRSGKLHLSTDQSVGSRTEVSGVSTVDLGSKLVEEEPVLNAKSSKESQSSSKQTDHSECKNNPGSVVPNKSSEPENGAEEHVSSISPSTANAVPGHREEEPQCENSLTPESFHPGKPKKVSSKCKRVRDVNKVLGTQPAHLPASNRLMTRALRAMNDSTKQDKVGKKAEQKQIHKSFRKADQVVKNHKLKHEFQTKIKALKSHHTDKSELGQGKISSNCSPSLMLSDSNDSEDVKSEDEDLSISSTPPMDFIPLTSKVKTKYEGQSSDKYSPSPPSPFSFLRAFRNVEEVSFQSLGADRSGKPISLKPKPNCKFSTFLMMLKDLHDTRERDGAPLELEIGPPSAHVKEEPLVMPGEDASAGRDQETSSAGQDQETAYALSDSSAITDKSVEAFTEGGASRTPKKSSNRRGNAGWFKRKPNRRAPCSPAKSGPGFPGLESLLEMMPAEDSLENMEWSSRVVDFQSSSWEERAGGSDVVVCEEHEENPWIRAKENLTVPVPLEQRECGTAEEQPSCLISDFVKRDSSFAHNSGEEDKTPGGKISLPKQLSLEGNEKNVYLKNK